MADINLREGFSPKPLEFNLNGTRLMLALQEAGLDMKKLDMKHLMEGSARGAEIEELESRLQEARASNWSVGVGVVVRY